MSRAPREERRGQEGAERGERGRKETPVGDPGGGDQRAQRRKGEGGQQTVRGPELQGPADDCCAAGSSGGESSQAQPGARRERLAGHRTR